MSLVLLVSGLVFILFLVQRSWGQLVELLRQADWLLFVVSIFVGITGILASSMLFRILLKKYGLDVPSGLAHRIFFYGQVAKYVPGKIWGIMYQVAAVGKQGASIGITSANLDLMLVSIFMNLSIAAALIVFPVSMLGAVGILLSGAAMALVASGSHFSGEVFRRLIPKSYVQSPVLSPPDWKVLSVKVGAYFVTVFVTSLLSYYLMMNAVFGFTLQESATYMAYLILSWVVGVFAFLVPAGVGVRELVFITVGTTMMDGISIELLVSIALISRCWQIAQDLVVAAIVSVLGVIRIRASVT
ncbi:MAG TPA: hypothetical protein ENI62_00325 [Gammaproteobacteria bacterium]|nr:hypothetical protein [Gammaproteobacteria bacterium]